MMVRGDIIGSPLRTMAFTFAPTKSPSIGKALITYLMWDFRHSVGFLEFSVLISNHCIMPTLIWDSALRISVLDGEFCLSGDRITM